MRMPAGFIVKLISDKKSNRVRLKYEPYEEGMWGEDEYGQTICTNCGSQVNADQSYFYCPYCGSRNDW